MFIFIILLGIILFFVIKYFFNKNYKVKFDFITFFEGGEGSGKTSLLTYFAITEYKKRFRQYKRRKFFNNFIPFKRFELKYPNMDVYSDYPILLDKRRGIYSKVIDNRLLTWQYKVTRGSIIVLDEMGYFYPLELKMEDKQKVFTITFLRHVVSCDDCGNHGRIFASSQSMSEVNKTFRRKCNRTYQLSGCRKGLIPFISRSKVNMLEVYLSEDITNSVVDEDSFNNNVFKFRYPKGCFESEYAKPLYELKQSQIKVISQDYSELLNLLDLKIGERWKSLFLTPFCFSKKEEKEN